MTKKIELNGEIHEFPDDATDEQISDALTNLGKPKKGFGNLLAPLNPLLKMATNAPAGIGQPNEVLKNALTNLGKPAPDIEDKSRAAIEAGLNFAMPFVPQAAKGLFKGAKAGIEGTANTVKSALENVKPFEEAAEKAGQEYGMAEKAAETPKPGLIEKPQTEIEQVENEIGTHINAEGAHDVRASKQITNDVNSVKKYWSDSWKNFMNKITEKNFQMPEQSINNLDYDMNAIMKRVQQGSDPKTVIKDMERETKSLENPFYKDLMITAPTAADTDAATFLAKQRDFRDTLNGFKADLKSEKYGSLEKKKIKEAIDKGKEVEAKIKQALDEGLGEFKNEFNWLNEGFSQQFYPLTRNPVVKNAQQGKLSSNIINDLRTNESGMPVLREIVKRNPELLRNVVGQRYMANPSEILNPDELMREYLGEMPEFNKLLQKKEVTLEKATKRKDISLQQKLKAEKELKEIKDAKKKAYIKLGKGAAYGLGGALGLKTTSNLYSRD